MDTSSLVKKAAGTAAVAVLLAACSSGGSASGSPGGSASSGSSPAGRLTKANYDKVHDGMSEAQVTALVGHCATSNETTVAGIESKTITCEGDQPNTSAVFTFTNGTLQSKTEIGLADVTAAGGMTLAKFDQLSTGMTTDQVLAVTGPCDKVSDTTVAGIEAVSYKCNASDGIASAILLFQNGKLFSKTQVGLK